MILTVYLTILAYYVIGTAGIYAINRKKDSETRHKAWLKLLFAFIFTNVVFLSIVFNTLAFTILAVVVIIAGCYELFKLFRNSGYQHRGFFISSMIVMAVSSAGFYLFSLLDMGLILFSFLILSIFDAFSQITGQLFGRTKLLPRVSPNKTVEGLAGGTIIAVISGIIFCYVIPAEPLRVIPLTLVIVIFAFFGDFAKSLYKRKYNVKDFSNFIPGHGGILDRFDSLIGAGAGVALMSLIMSL